MNKKIVIADDEPDILNLLTVLFRSKGYEVLVASEGETALKLILESHPVAAILDFMMPLMDGLTVCEQAKQADPNLFVVIASGVNNEKLRSFSKNVQADEYLEKPLRMAILVEKIKLGVARRIAVESQPETI